MPTLLASIALALAVLALVVAFLTYLRVRPTAATTCPPMQSVCARRWPRSARRPRGALRHLAVVRYDAFEEMGGRLSWSLALLDDGGDGVVLTSIRGRNEARTYAKSVTTWRSDQELSPEETEAITHAQP